MHFPVPRACIFLLCFWFNHATFVKLNDNVSQFERKKASDRESGPKETHTGGVGELRTDSGGKEQVQ
jgi:hypothetical protein